MLWHRGLRFGFRVEMAAKVEPEARHDLSARETDVSRRHLVVPLASDNTLAGDQLKHRLLSRLPRLQRPSLLRQANRKQRSGEIRPSSPPRPLKAGAN